MRHFLLISTVCALLIVVLLQIPDHCYFSIFTSYLLSPSLTQLQAYWPPCDSSNMSGMSQGLCTCCFFCHKCSSPGICINPHPSLSSIDSDVTSVICPFPALFLHNTSHHLAYYFTCFIYCQPLPIIRLYAPLGWGHYLLCFLSCPQCLEWCLVHDR